MMSASNWCSYLKTIIANHTTTKMSGTLFARSYLALVLFFARSYLALNLFYLTFVYVYCVQCRLQVGIPFCPWSDLIPVVAFLQHSCITRQYVVLMMGRHSFVKLVFIIFGGCLSTTINVYILIQFVVTLADGDSFLPLVIIMSIGCLSTLLTFV